MHYSKYFGALVRDNGLPQMGTSSFQKLMNIVSLEGTIEGLKTAKKLHVTEPNKFDMEIFRRDKRLTTLTGNVAPKELMRMLLS